MTSPIRNPRILVPAVAVLLVGLAWLAIGYFGLHTLFIDEEVSDALPTFDAAPDEPPTTDATPTPAPASPEPATPAPGDTPITTPDTTAEAIVTAAPTAPEIVTEASGTFESGAHPTRGTAAVLGNGTGQRFLRFEDFETDNGPDLNVYLVNSSTGDVSDVIDLGDLRGNVGEQNYEIPGGVDLDVYDRVVIWCVRFGVGFGQADLMAM
jgi:hypothetical protein